MTAAPVFKSIVPSPKSRALDPPTTAIIVSAEAAAAIAASNPSRDGSFTRQPGAYTTSLKPEHFARTPSNTVTICSRSCGDV
ncbi:hypothetical protein D3C71_1424960 [compost metagenome]